MNTAPHSPDLSAPTGRDYSTSFVVDTSPEDVFATVLDVASWWTGQVEGRSDELGAEFTYRHPPQHYSRQRVVGFEPGRRLAWRVTDSDLSFVPEPGEWNGSEIVFDLVPTPGGTEVRFTHVGLVPDVECFGACSAGWRHYVDGSLRARITTGAGLPDPW